SVGGRIFTQQYAPAANLVHDFTWDGTDAYGREITGGQAATARITYVYGAFYALPPALAASFGAASGVRVPGDVPGRGDVRFTQVQSFTVPVGVVAIASSVGGWSPSVHHTYDPDS